jgi:hypothetical protein
VPLLLVLVLLSNTLAAVGEATAQTTAPCAHLRLKGVALPPLRKGGAVVELLLLLLHARGIAGCCAGRPSGTDGPAAATTTAAAAAPLLLLRQHRCVDGSIAPQGPPADLQ